VEVVKAVRFRLDPEGEGVGKEEAEDVDDDDDEEVEEWLKDNKEEI
jgi:phosphopantothenoylcysteine synthetase/decarboxylase